MVTAVVDLFCSSLPVWYANPEYNPRTMAIHNMMFTFSWRICTSVQHRVQSNCLHPAIWWLASRNWNNTEVNCKLSRHKSIVSDHLVIIHWPDSGYYSPHFSSGASTSNFWLSSLGSIYHRDFFGKPLEKAVNKHLTLDGNCQIFVFTSLLVGILLFEKHGYEYFITHNDENLLVISCYT